MVDQRLNKKIESVKTDILSKLQGPIWVLTLPLFFLFGFIPLRFISFFLGQSIPTTYVYMIGLFFLISCALLVKRFIPFCLNSKIIQGLFYFGLSLENFIYSLKGFEAFYLTLSTFLIITLWPALILELLADIKWSYWFYLLFVSSIIYLKLRRMFLFPPQNLVPELATLDCITLPNDEKYFTWETIYNNINKFSVGLYGFQIKNRLPLWTNRSLTEVGRRYMINWGIKVEPSDVAKIMEAPKPLKAVFTFFAALALFGGAYSLQTDRINAEANLEKAKAASIEANARLNESKAALNNSEAALNNSEAEKFSSAARYLDKFTSFPKTKDEVGGFIITKDDKLDSEIAKARKEAGKAIDSYHQASSSGDAKALSLADTDSIFTTVIKKIYALIDFL